MNRTKPYSVEVILSDEQADRIAELERAIDRLEPPQPPPSVFQVYENKQFNVLKRELPALSARDIYGLIAQQWDHLPQAERQPYLEIADEANKRYCEELRAACKRKSELLQQIHDIKFSVGNPSVKASGKLKYMSAYRFFRRDSVPMVKEQNPDLDGKQRQAIIRAAWKKLPEEAKFSYVLMSRLDRERALYMHKVAQINEDMQAHGNFVVRLPAHITQFIAQQQQDSRVAETSDSDSTETH